jgi:hypothetical protein
VRTQNDRLPQSAELINSFQHLSIGRLLVRHGGVGTPAFSNSSLLSTLRKTIMANSRLKNTGLVLAAAITLGVALSFTLPKTVHIERSALVSATPQAVYAALSSPATFHQFNPFRDLHADLKETITGPTTGLGATYAWASSGGNGSQTIVSMQPNAQITMQLELGPRGRPTQTFLIAPAEGGSTVSWVQDADLGYNPIARVIGTTLDKKLGPVYERGLQKLSLMLNTKTSQLDK